jgi:hypothetical protein
MARDHSDHSDPNPHHLILGRMKDFLTGKELIDTHDERYRQKIAKILVLEKHFDKKDIHARTEIEINAAQKKAGIKIDFLINLFIGQYNRTVMLIQYAPGSLVTRRLSTLALSRIVRPYQIPIVVITNGEDAEIISGDSGKVISTGLQNIPDKTDLIQQWSSFSFKAIDSLVFNKASGIVFACEIDDACPCDSDICII